MKCFSLINDKIIEGITTDYSNTLNTDVIQQASVRFYINDQLGQLTADMARQRYGDLFLYGYTELIPESEPGNLFPEGSYLLDLPISQYNTEASKQCMKIQTCTDHILLGCINDSVINTTIGNIVMKDGELVVDNESLSTDRITAPVSVLVMEI